MTSARIIRAQLNAIRKFVREVTALELEQFGFFSGLRANARDDIMLVRFDLTVLIGTWLFGENARAGH